ALSDRTVAARENGRQPFAIDTVVSAINPTSHGKPIEVFKDPPPPCFRTSRTGAAYLVREIGHPVSIGLPSGFPVTGTTFLKILPCSLAKSNLCFFFCGWACPAPADPGAGRRSYSRWVEGVPCWPC